MANHNIKLTVTIGLILLAILIFNQGKKEVPGGLSATYIFSLSKNIGRSGSPIMYIYTENNDILYEYIFYHERGKQHMTLTAPQQLILGVKNGGFANTGDITIQYDGGSKTITLTDFATSDREYYIMADGTIVYKGPFSLVYNRCDINKDSSVNVNDLDSIFSCIGKPVVGICARADYTNNVDVAHDDVILFSDECGVSCQYGDVNCNNVIDCDDADFLIECIVDNNLAWCNRADLNNDGSINQLDLNALFVITGECAICDNPGDTNTDCTITLPEVITYANKWVNNQGVTLQQVIAVANIWVSGGSY